MPIYIMRSIVSYYVLSSTCIPYVISSSISILIRNIHVCGIHTYIYKIVHLIDIFDPTYKFLGTHTSYRNVFCGIRHISLKPFLLENITNISYVSNSIVIIYISVIVYVSYRIYLSVLFRITFYISAVIWLKIEDSYSSLTYSTSSAIIENMSDTSKLADAGVKVISILSSYIQVKQFFFDIPFYIVKTEG